MERGRRWGVGRGRGAVLGSIVQKGKFREAAIDFWARALKREDFPTFGSPIIPTRIFIAKDWQRGFAAAFVRGPHFEKLGVNGVRSMKVGDRMCSCSRPSHGVIEQN